MGDTGKQYIMIEGTGKIYGMVVIKQVNETRSNFFITVVPVKSHLMYRSPLQKTPLKTDWFCWPDAIKSGRFIPMNVLSQVQAKYNSLNNYPNAIYRVTVNDVDISSHLASRLISMTIQDNRGMVADSVDITLDDSDNALEIPEIFAELKVWLGWSDTGLVYKGSYKVTQVSHSGTPDQMSISAEAEDLAEGFRQKREKSWDMVTIQDIIEYIARQYALLPVIHESLIDQEIAHIDQNESDANLITRVADEYDAIATVKMGIYFLCQEECQKQRQA